MIYNLQVKQPGPKPPREECLEFISNDGNDFILGFSADRNIFNAGHFEVSYDKLKWEIWDSRTTNINSVNGKIYICGVGLTELAKSNDGISMTDGSFVITPQNSTTKIACNGNIECLLDYTYVAKGQHPPITSFCCFGGLFYNCTCLVKGPTISTIQSFPNSPSSNSRYGMFSHTFSGCSSLIEAPELPNVNISNNNGCYNDMFRGCSSLTNAPYLNASDLSPYCYSGMFQGCTKLQYVPYLYATTLKVNCYANMFMGCTSLVNPPSLPATVLANRCYTHMFDGCSSLATLVNLPATTLATDCYYFMFRNCPKIHISATQQSGYNNIYRIPKTGSIAGTSTINYMFDEIDNLNINRDYYTPNTIVG